VLDDARAHLEQPFADGREFRFRERVGLRNGVAHGESQPVGGGVKREPHLIGRRAVTRHTVRRQLRLVQLSVISVFDGVARALFEGMAGLVWIDSLRNRACRRARGRQGRYAPLARWPEDVPSLTAAVRDGTGCVQVGAEGWCRSNKRMGQDDVVPRNFPLPLPARCIVFGKRKWHYFFRPSFIDGR
jgi:hypothetical protein